MEQETMAFDIGEMSDLQTRLTNDGVVAGLPYPGRVSILMELGSARFIVNWDERAFEVCDTVGINDTWDFGFSVPAAAWEEFSKADPAPLNNTAQALVAQFGERTISGNRLKWAQ